MILSTSSVSELDDAAPLVLPSTSPDFRLIFESSPGLTVVLALDGTVVAASEGYVKARRVEREALLGRPPFDAAPATAANAAAGRNVLASIERVVATGTADLMGVQTYDVAAEGAEGGIESRRYRVTSVPVRGDEGAVRYVIQRLDEARSSASIPPGERKHRPPSVPPRRTERVHAPPTTVPPREDLLGLFSHEFRTPLTTIWLDLQRLERQSDALAPRHHQAVLRMAVAARRLQTVIEAFLEYGHIRSGRLVTRSERFDLASLVRELVGEYERQTTRPQLAFRCRVATHHPIDSDPVLVRLILANLLDNAVKFTQRGSVEVEAWSDERGHHIVVRDTGPGIPPEHIDRIFEPFEQVGPLHHKSVPGVGLGLSIVRDVAAALDGRAEVRSVPGHGSTFTIFLPGTAPREELPAG
jgi:signal transduction histidine kinase